MGVFSRVRDIINSNINAMLDKAEDPEKLVRLMIGEMEDTLVEIKASCAQAMAGQKRVRREHAEAGARAADWQAKAQLAVDKGREDLAREALVEKRRYADRADVLFGEAAHFDEIIERYQDDIVQLEEKLATAREKQRVLVQRHRRAQGKRRAQENIRRVETSDALLRFDKFESRIDRMEAEADLVNYGRKRNLLDDFAELETDEDIERELAELKEARRNDGAKAPASE
ncbi:MAG TPA: phage shock protein PspA [Candidatus Hydrogenedentes bacterium]|nr:phage shock protein PspA [Candidatus Hydrogenedentota bacterium]HPG69070.1 phage shock protein PspA [Candidatus Hydrogenedentota bacterium]